jgi:hypothetical protein
MTILARQITGECGHLVRGDTEQEVVDRSFGATTRSSPTRSRATRAHPAGQPWLVHASPVEALQAPACRVPLWHVFPHRS